jgi:heat shock protein HslJ
MWRLVIILLLAVGTWLAGCAGPAGEPLEDITWVLESYGEPGNTNAVLPDAEVTVMFESSSGEVGGSAGCNHFGGTYKLDGNKLTLPGPMMVTEMWCGDQLNDQENEYLDALHSAQSFEITDGKLTINCRDTVLIYRPK